jgi:hypothetical protein
MKYHISSIVMYSETRNVHSSFKKYVNNGYDWLVVYEFWGTTNYVVFIAFNTEHLF